VIWEVVIWEVVISEVVRARPEYAADGVAAVVLSHQTVYLVSQTLAASAAWRRPPSSGAMEA